jgi:hypothetical protein
LVGLYEIFRADIKALGMNLAKNDDVLWQMFRTKVDLIRGEMLQLGELQWTSEGLKYMKLPQKKPSQSTLGKQPPTTPVLPTEHFSDGMELWNSSDSNAQLQMFRKMLHTAKDPQCLISECQEYCAETRSKEEGEVRDDNEALSNRHVIEETNATATQRPTPPKTPDPISTSLDLKTMIDKRLREMRLKRALETQALESSEGDEVDEEIDPKRIKFEPLT